MNKQPIEWKNVTSYISDRGKTSRKFKDVKKLTVKKSKQNNRKMVHGIKKNSPKELQITNKHFRKCHH